MTMQQEFHAYRDGVYAGIHIATPEQLADQGLVAGAAPTLDPEVVLAEMRQNTPPLTFAQTLIGLVAEGFITEAEGEAWLLGVLPDAVNVLINSLPAGQRFAARATAVRPTQIVRMNGLLRALADARIPKVTPAELDAFFATYRNVT